MRFRCAFVALLCGTVPGQQRAQGFEVKDVLAALKDKTGGVQGSVKPIDRLARFVNGVESSEIQVGKHPLVAMTSRAAGRDFLVVQGAKEGIDLVKSLLDQMRCDQLPRFHLTCTVLVMPAELAASHGLVTYRVQETDMVAISKLMKDVVKEKGTLLNLPEVVATPFVPFVAEPRIGAAGKLPAPKDPANLRLRGESLALSSEEALFAVQFVRGSLPEDRTVLPKEPLCAETFRLRAGSGVTMTAKDDTTATVMWLRLTSISNDAPKLDKSGVR